MDKRNSLHYILFLHLLAIHHSYSGNKADFFGNNLAIDGGGGGGGMPVLSGTGFCHFSGYQFRGSRFMCILIKKIFKLTW